jgi:predicted O-methyltransferase YrrM
MVVDRIARRLRWYWERIRPFPSPRYVAGTPRVDGGPRPDLYVCPTAQTLGEAALSPEAALRVGCVLERLTSCEELVLKQMFYRLSHEKFGAYWRYADLFTMLWAATRFIEPKSYLEIGVCRGWSAAVVAAAAPEVDIYGFDLWPDDYRGIDLPGPDFVRSELQTIGHRGSTSLVSGDSESTVPTFLAARPDLYFDLITVDGGKSVQSFSSDLANALPRLEVGGALVVDDLPRVQTLRRVWDRVVARDGRFSSWEFADAGSGVAVAIRVSDGAPVPKLHRDA